MSSPSATRSAGGGASSASPAPPKGDHFEAVIAEIRAAVGEPDGPAPRSARGRATCDKLLAAGAEVFGERGYEQTRVEDIVGRAGFAHGSFYRYFPDKDAILQEILVRLYAELNVATRTESHGEEAASLHELTRRLEAYNIRFFHEYAARRGLLRVAREAAASSSSQRFREIWFAMRGRFVARTRRLIERLQQRGHAAGLDARLTAEALGATSEQMAYVLVGLPAELPAKRELDAIGRACNEIWVRTLLPETAVDGEPA